MKLRYFKTYSLDPKDNTKVVKLTLQYSVNHSGYEYMYDSPDTWHDVPTVVDEKSKEKVENKLAAMAYTGSKK